jgi:RNA polymerase sigma-B factor
VRDLLGTLPSREATMLYLRFYADLTQSEIATHLGISQVHVSRLMQSALTALRAATDTD